MTDYYKLYRSHGYGRCYVVNVHYKRLVHAIEMCRILYSQVMVTFTDHLHFLMNS